MNDMVKKIARWVVLSALFIIPFLVLYVSDSLYFPFITGKGFAFRILVEIALAGWAVLALTDKKYRPQFSWTFVLYGALVVWMIIADALAVSPEKAFWSNLERMDGWITLVHVFAFFAIAGAVLTADKLWKNWWLTFLASSALVSLYGVFQLLGVFAIHQGGVRLDATLGNSEYLAGYLLFAIAIALWQAMETRGWLKYVLYALTALNAVVLFYTATRGAILGAVGAILLGAVLWMFEAGKTGRRNALIALAAVVVIAGGVYVLRHNPIVANDPTLSRLSSISASDGATRFTIWHMALEGFEARPVTGWGQEGFNYIFNTYYEPSLYAQEPWFDRAHNVFLDWLTAGGLPALLLFLALLGSAVFAFYRGTVSRGERVILVATFAAYAFQGLFVFDNLFTYIPLAALLALAHNASSRPWKKLESLPVLSVSMGQTAGTVALVVAAVVIWFVNVPSIAAAHDLILALSPASDPTANETYFKDAFAEHSFETQEITEQLVTYAGSAVSGTALTDAEKQELVTYMLTQMQAEVAARPKDARILLQLSLAYRVAGDIPDAYKTTQAALALSPEKPQIIEEAGVEAWQLGDTQTAAADFTNIYTLTPASDDAATYAAAGQIILGNTAGAKQILMSHFATTTVQSQILIYAYYGVKDYPDIVTLLEANYASSPTPDVGFELATGYALEGNTAAAKALMASIVAAYPQYASQGAQFLAQYHIQ